MNKDQGKTRLLVCGTVLSIIYGLLLYILPSPATGFLEEPKDLSWEALDGESMSGSDMMTAIYTASEQGGIYTISVDNDVQKKVYTLDPVRTRYELAPAFNRQGPEYVNPDDVYQCRLEKDKSENIVRVEFSKDKK